jgi:hemerythrin superfamily protein
MSTQPESQVLNISEAAYLQMTQRFDHLWAAARAKHEQAEMQRLLQQIEQYEKHRDSGGNSGNKAHT